MKRYKLWVHMEEIPENPNEDPRSMDNEYLPIPAGIFDTPQEAEEVMWEISNLFYEENKGTN